MSPLSEFEADLAEIKKYQPYARRIFSTGANPFAMSYDNLKIRALTVRDYLIKCQSIAMFASIRDIKSKSVKQLKKLRALGINGLSIGTESADDTTLALAYKGYTSTDIYEWAQTGKFIPAGEHERIKELIVLLEHLQIRTHILADTKSNFKPLTGYIPKEKAKLIGQLQYVIDTVDEQEMIDYRNSLHSL